MKKRFFASAILIGVYSFIYAQPADSLFSPQVKNLKFNGYLGHKIDACISNGILATDENYLIEPFRTRNEKSQWQSEFWGKWFTSASAAYNYNADKRLRVKLDNAVKGLLATQSQDGYIGNYAPEFRLQEWDIWGMKYCLLGLLDYYNITKDNNTLTATKKLADYVSNAIIKSGKKMYQLGNYKGMAAASILEPIVKLYNITREKRYLDFANYIVDSWKDPQSSQLIIKALDKVPVGQRSPVPAVWYGPENGQKAYEMMSCYEGLLELYRVTGKREYLEAVLAAAENILETEIMITGSGASMECWFGGKATQAIPVKHTMEACVTVTWMKLCLQLLRVTGDAKWANEIEKSYYNALLGTMKPDGSTWSKYIGMQGVKILGEDQCGMTTNCCIANGPRGIMLAASEALMVGKDRIAVNLYSKLKAAVYLNGNKNNAVEIAMETDYPVSGNVSITINPQRNSTFALLLRIPEWSRENTISVNGNKVDAFLKNGYLNIYRLWKKGDVVTISFDMQVRSYALAKTPYKYALLYGPLVLASDKRYQQTPFYETYQPVLKNGSIPFTITAKERNAHPLIEIKLPLSKEVDGLKQEAEELSLIDFASAGNTWSDSSAYEVWFQKIRDVSKEKN